MKTGHFEMTIMLLAALILVDIFQVKSEVLDMAENVFDDQYLKCADRMENKFIPQLLEEEKNNQQLLKDVWENAKTKWEVRKTQRFFPVTFKDNHGIALMAYISEAQKQSDFYYQFNEAMKMAGKSRKDYIYDFQFKAFHFYLTKALQLLRRPCKESYKNVVYNTSQISFTFGGLDQARFNHVTMVQSTKPEVTNDQDTLLTIYTCFGIDVKKFLGEGEKNFLISPNEVFHVSQDGTGNNLILHSTNKTCSHYECAFLGGLKSTDCAENAEYLQTIYIFSPVEKSQTLEEPEMESQESTLLPGVKNHEPTPRSAPAPAPVPVPGPKTHPSASSSKMLLPSLGMAIILTVLLL
ncbi:ecto-ADP-ribosyltransferase 3 isoform X1 [Sorex fumeus]|uniref:ecto-ADP-ribosyltransferase 3 isoform X1 n=1 Tax=Sorex fumeus TaxID=62283 RepID=UPI0024AD539F|nr:ecto-ADP-ribosyltransferase 3 isoform X1 [Sorex fumeus]XP_055967227.1 ecto-ADP-ribosyltransferase 3 isoform X1 [Sorex fumeus]